MGVALMLVSIKYWEDVVTKINVKTSKHSAQYMKAVLVLTLKEWDGKESVAEMQKQMCLFFEGRWGTDDRTGY